MTAGAKWHFFEKKIKCLGTTKSDEKSTHQQESDNPAKAKNNHTRKLLFAPTVMGGQNKHYSTYISRGYN